MLFRSVATRNRWDDPREARFRTQGYALPDVELRVVDPASGTPRAAGEVGEIWLRGYCVMKGYYRNPQATAEAMRPRPTSPSCLPRSSVPSM